MAFLKSQQSKVLATSPALNHTQESVSVGAPWKEREHKQTNEALHRYEAEAGIWAQAGTLRMKQEV